MTSPPDKASWLTVAESWLRLAEVAEAKTKK
jgi:hypothetical protein